MQAVCGKCGFNLVYIPDCHRSPPTASEGIGLSQRDSNTTTDITQDEELFDLGTPTRARELGGNLAGLTLGQQIFRLAMWPFFQHVLAFMVGMVDIWLTKYVGEESGSSSAGGSSALNAVAVAAYLGWGMWVLPMSMMTGANALVARLCGERKRREANVAVMQAMIVGVVLSTVSGILMLLGLDWILSELNMTDETLPMAKTYMIILSFAMPFIGIMTAGNQSMRGAGDTKIPFIALAMVNVVNVVVSGTLVGMDYGVAGIATGTALGWITGAVVVFYFLAKGKSSSKLMFRWKRFHRNWAMIRRIIKVGLPSFGESAGVWGIHFTMFYMIAALGGAVKGSHLLVVRMEGLAYMPGWAFALPATTLAGQYIGLGDPVRARKAVKLCWMMAVIFMTAIGSLFVLCPETLLGVIAKNPKNIELAKTPLMICFFFQPLFATMMVLKGAFKGAGDTRTPMLITWFSALCVRLVGVSLVVYFFADAGLVKWIVAEWGISLEGWNLFGWMETNWGIKEHPLTYVWVVMNLDIAVQAILAMIKYPSDSWLNKKI
jgi:putative MATE family efflux protein